MAKFFRAFKQNELFRPDFERADFNACVGDNGGPYSLYDYAYGYFEATVLLLESVRKEGWVNDLIVYPICLNLRHAVELYIKYLISDLTKLTRSNAKFHMNHSLQGNWSTALHLIKQTKLDVDPNEIRFVTGIVTDIMEVDPNGSIFRYPESIKGDQHLKEWAIVNLAVVNDLTSLLVKIVKEWHYKIEARIEAANEKRPN
ncbi:hypothetical protein [Bradyrhizobium mercantei]|uniref:hypothetical protein n=1 Tax=Bradyrhizobium mercantei TaxID=1904807 RepID=UPI0009760B49|nr:hypothetical protein [Bradyrhizobium mercantei]